jgi:hypothetical protein
MKISPSSHGILLLAITAGSLFGQMKSANLDPDAWYSITAVHSGKALEIEGGIDGKANGLVLQQNEPTGAANQLFALVKETSGNYRIIARSTGYGFDVLGGVKAMGDNAYIPPFDAAVAGLKPLFDGKTLNGWVGNPACWKVIDGAIVGLKDNQNLMTASDYEDFRIILSTRQVNAPSNHQGVGFWGDRLPEGQYGYGGCVLVMPPMNWTWDYTVNRGAPGRLTLSRDLEKERGIKRSEWTQAEILVNRAKGTIRMAVNGIEVLSYVDDNPGRLKKGPIGLQAHAGNQDVRYKDIFIEVDPKDDRLITLKK